jgi:branched-subunit amino acid aminotransferase/4-amino-4-deoxychorismate lyase
MVIPTLIETMRVEGGRAPLWHLHVRRMSESCLALGVPLPRALTVPHGADRVLRWEIGPAGIQECERPLPAPAPLRLITSRVRHRAYPHKTTDRAPFDQARAEALGRGADDGILLTAQGQWAECGIWSLFCWLDGGLAAPPPSLGVLRSISRMRIEELAEQGRLEWSTAWPPLAPPRESMPALIAANAVRGVVPVAQLDGVPVPGDPRTLALAQAFWP